ncbi:hypothetical protein HanPSC8_Chr09g0379641 [Helianthus annuus]|nr:hypothetical protein HanPSC8_Chr09g0379641 [Helianthus annuus]
MGNNTWSISSFPCSQCEYSSSSIRWHICSPISINCSVPSLRALFDHMPHLPTTKTSSSKSATNAWVMFVAMITQWVLGRILISLLIQWLSLDRLLVLFSRLSPLKNRFGKTVIAKDNSLRVTIDGCSMHSQPIHA